MPQERTQETDMETTHKKPETYTCLGTISKTVAMIHARDIDNDTILENVGRNNQIDWFDLSRLAMTGDKTTKIQILTTGMHKTDVNHQIKSDNMIFNLILDDKATIIQPGPETRHARIVEELITLLEKVKLVLIV